MMVVVDSHKQDEHYVQLLLSEKHSETEDNLAHITGTDLYNIERNPFAWSKQERYYITQLTLLVAALLARSYWYIYPSHQ